MKNSYSILLLFFINIQLLFSQEPIKKFEIHYYVGPTINNVSKPGYVAIFEYFKKEKYAEIRLEKIDL